VNSLAPRAWVSRTSIPCACWVPSAQADAEVFTRRDENLFGATLPAGSIPGLSVTERAVYGASMSLVPQLWLNMPNALACSR
jgi:hypothetical protein